MNNSSRINHFKELCNLCEIPFRKVPRHVKTRWNFFYEMLDVAYKYRKAITMQFNAHTAYSEYKFTDDNWTNVNELVKFLKAFYDAAKVFSGMYYPTISEILIHVCEISSIFTEYKYKSLFETPIEAIIQKFKKKIFYPPNLFNCNSF